MKVLSHDSKTQEHLRAVSDLLAARTTLEEGRGPSPNMRGWLDPKKLRADGRLDEIRSLAQRIRQSDALVVVGIGGSYLGARAVIDALTEPFADGFPIIYAGHNMDPTYHAALLEHLKGKDFWVNVISKSGGTTEPAAALRLLGQLLEAQGRSPADRIVATTDPAGGILRGQAERQSLATLPVPPDVGGRFSVLTPVGLLPAAAAGVDVDALFDGAVEMAQIVRASENDSPETNPALAYAAHRLAAYRGGKKIEVMTSFCARLEVFTMWWRQLFGESEGKEGKGIFPSTAIYSTDLHSLGQWMQEGERTVFETFISPEEPGGPVIPAADETPDPLPLLAGKPLERVNQAALNGTIEAHEAGGVPCARIEPGPLNAKNLGALIYMMEYSCALGALALNVDPFNQPGVERYKKAMKTILES